MNIDTLPFALLQDASPLKTSALINSQWVDGQISFDVNNPTTDLKIASVANLGSTDAEAAIASANTTWPGRRAKARKERSILLRKWFDLLLANQNDLGRIMTSERGKLLAEAKGEVAYTASFVESYAEEAESSNGETQPQFGNNRRLMIINHPIGACAAVTPWNFPMAMITCKMAPAIATGCRVIIKPREITPLTALAAAELALSAGIPAGVVSLISADSVNSIAIGKKLCASDVVRHKQSRLGREGFSHGMDEYLEMNYLCLGDLAAK